jgi:hypothetical protein
VPVSAGLLTDTSAYFHALTDYREGYLDTIVRQFVNASFRAIGNGRILVDDLERTFDAWSENLTSRRGSAARRLLPHLLHQPAVIVAHVGTVTGVALSAAQRAVEQLEEAGVLQRADGGQRNRSWIAQDVIAALDAFAERVGRRGSLSSSPLVPVEAGRVTGSRGTTLAPGAPRRRLVRRRRGCPPGRRRRW